MGTARAAATAGACARRQALHVAAASPHARAAANHKPKPARCGARGQAQIAVALTVLNMFYKLVVIAVSVRLQFVFIAWKEQAREAGYPAAAASSSGDAGCTSSGEVRSKSSLAAQDSAQADPQRNGKEVSWR